MNRLTLLIITLLLAGGICLEPAQARRRRAPAKVARTSSTVKTERSRTTKEIAETRSKIKETERQTRQRVEQLAGLDAGIQRQSQRINGLEQEIASLDAAIASTTDTIDSLRKGTEAMRADLKSTLRAMRGRRKAVNAVTFVFSAPDFTTAIKRVGYMKRINQYRAHRMHELQERTRQLTAREEQLRQLKEGRESARSQLDAARSTMQQQRNQQQTVVAQLQTESKNLGKVLSAKQQRLNQLDKELDRLIAEEQRAQEKAMEAKREAAKREAAKKEASKSAPGTAVPAKTAPQAPNKEGIAKTEPAGKEPEGRMASDTPSAESTFAASRGKLLFPVTGKYTVVGNFGRSEHHNLSNVKVNNSGIDIAAGANSWARAVYAGTVSSVFHMPGYGNIVILRHGQYLTVYAGLGTLSISKGAKVKAGAKLGQLLADPENPGRGLLHFEVRHEREKLNPIDWLP